MSEVLTNRIRVAVNEKDPGVILVCVLGPNASAEAILPSNYQVTLGSNIYEDSIASKSSPGDIADALDRVVQSCWAEQLPLYAGKNHLEVGDGYVILRYLESAFPSAGYRRLAARIAYFVKYAINMSFDL